MKPVTFGNLPINLMNYNFNDIFKLKPDDRSSVLVYNKDKNIHENKQIFRSYMAYGKTPDFDSKVKKSYMFSNKSEVIPDILLPFVDFAKTISPKYNQVVVNWYEKDDFIEPHRDCTANMLDKDCPILCLNLNEGLDERYLKLEAVDTNDKTKWKFELPNNTFYIINDNITFRHSVTKGSQKRISITFRMMRG